MRTLFLTTIVALAWSAATAHTPRLELRAGLESESGDRLGRARFEAREGRIRLRVEIDDLETSTEIGVSVGPATFVVVVDSSGRAEIEVESRDGAELPALEAGDEVVVTAHGRAIFDGAFGHRGDANSDLSMDISDAVTVLLALFIHPGIDVHWAAADGNDDAVLDVADAIWILEKTFVRGPGSGNDDGGDNDDEDADDCESRTRFVLDVDGDGRREDGHIRSRSRAQGDDIEIEVGPLEVDAVSILISDDGDAANAYFASDAPVLADGDAELELDDGLPQPLAAMIGDSVFVIVGDGEAVLLGSVPAPDCAADDSGEGGDDGGENDGGDGENPDDDDDGEARDDCEARADFELDVDGDGVREDGHVRTRRRDDRDDLEIEVGALEVDAVTILFSDDDDAANAYFAGNAPVLADGDAELELEHGLPQSLEELVGDRVFVQVGDAEPVFLGLVPDPACGDGGAGGDSGGDDGGNDGGGDSGDAGDCETRRRFELDVDGDGYREDGHIRVRRREDRDEVEIEVGPLESDSVTLLFSDDGDASNAYFTATLPVLATRDAELELKGSGQLPQALEEMIGDSVFLSINGGEPVAIGMIPETSCAGGTDGDGDGDGDGSGDDGGNDGDDNGGNDGGGGGDGGDTGTGECETRARFDLDVDGDGVREDGHVRVRRRDSEEDLEVEIGLVEVDSVMILISDDADPANAYYSAMATILGDGNAELEIEDRLPQSLAEMAGDSVFVRVGDGEAVLLTRVPSCSS